MFFKSPWTSNVQLKSRMFSILSGLIFKYGVIRLWPPQRAVRGGSVRKLWIILQIGLDGSWVFFRPRGSLHLRTANVFLPSYIKFSKNCLAYVILLPWSWNIFCSYFVTVWWRQWSPFIKVSLVKVCLRVSVYCAYENSKYCVHSQRKKLYVSMLISLFNFSRKIPKLHFQGVPNSN